MTTFVHIVGLLVGLACTVMGVFYTRNFVSTHREFSEESAEAFCSGLLMFLLLGILPMIMGASIFIYLYAVSGS